MKGAHPSAVITDADVLIDFMTAAPHLLHVMATKLWAIHVPHLILREVDQLTATQAREMGIHIYSPTLDEMREAAVRGGALSQRDKLCLVIARNHGWACLTNDVLLRRHCRERDVTVIWGLESLGVLFKQSLATKRQVIDAAQAIHTSNPRFITKSILARFLESL